MLAIVDYFNSRIKRFTIFDIKLLQGIGIFVALILTKLFPQIMEISIWWFIALLVISIVRPFYVVFLQK